MAHRFSQPPRSCDLLDLVNHSAGDGGTSDVSGVARAPVDAARGFLVWLIDDRDSVVVRSAATLTGAAETARAYCAAWGGHVRYIEGPSGELVDRDQWEHLAQSQAPLPYVYTVELRSPRSAGRDELVTALWTSTDLAEALRWRGLLPAHLRGRTLVVSNAPDGHHPNPRPTRSTADADR